MLAVGVTRASSVQASVAKVRRVLRGAKATRCARNAIDVAGEVEQRAVERQGEERADQDEEGRRQDPVLEEAVASKYLEAETGRGEGEEGRHGRCAGRGFLVAAPIKWRAQEPYPVSKQ